MLLGGWYRGYKAEDLKLIPEELTCEISLGGHTVTQLNPLTSFSHILFKLLNAFSVTPNQSPSLLKRIIWSLVSKELERSSNVSAVTLPASIDARISLGILRRPVSVE